MREKYFAWGVHVLIPTYDAGQVVLRCCSVDVGRSTNHPDVDIEIDIAIAIECVDPDL